MNNRLLSVNRMSLITGLLLCMLVGNSYAECSDPPAANVDWHGCDKRHLQLQNVNLSNANLTQTNLNHSDLEGANLSNADLTGASLLGVNLQGTNLTAAKVISAFLTKSRIAGANLTDAIFDNTYWVNAKHCKVGSVGECN